MTNIVLASAAALTGTPSLPGLSQQLQPQGCRTQIAANAKPSLLTPLERNYGIRTFLLDHLAPRAGVVLTLLSLAACAGNGEGLDANGQPLAAGSTGSLPPLSDDFASIQANIFTPICSVCHNAAAARRKVCAFDAADSYNLLVGVPSTEVPSLLRVKPGDPDNSYIIQKLEGHAAVGAQMPDGCPSTQPCLTTSTIAFIRQWITDGKRNDSLRGGNCSLRCRRSCRRSAGRHLHRAG